jgi:DNA mismatch repair ATPase MutS
MAGLFCRIILAGLTQAGLILHLILKYNNGYIVHLIKASKEIAGADIPGIREYSKKLKESSGKIKSLTIESFYPFFYKTNDCFLEPLKILFLVELIVFERLSKIIYSRKIEIRNLYETIGFLDSMVAIASYRETLDFYTVPSLYKSGVSGHPTLFFKDLFHPLLKKPVTNSVTLGKPILITGSNASGKSTFLKTIAINAI